MRRHRIRHPREELCITWSENLPEASDGIPGVSWWQDDPYLEALFAEVSDDFPQRLVGGELEKVPPRPIDQQDGRLWIPRCKSGVQIPAEVLDIGKEDVASGAYQQHPRRNGDLLGVWCRHSLHNLEWAAAQLEQQSQDADQYGGEYAVQGARHDYGQCRDDRQNAIPALDGEDATQSVDVYQPDGRYKDQRAQRCLREIAKQWGQQKQRQDHRCCGADGRHGTSSTRPIIDSSL
jgi:hypothetical protein